MVAVEVVTLVAVALLGVLVVGLLRSNAELHRALHGLGVELGADARPGTSARATSISLSPRPTPARPDAGDVPDLAGSTPTGDAVSLAVGGARHDTLIAFLSSGCSTCRAFWDVLADGPDAVPGGARLVVVTRGSEVESPAAIAGMAGRADVVMSTATWLAYDVPYAPYFVYVDGPNGRVIGEGAAATWDAMTTLVEGALADGGRSAAPTVTPLPKAAADAAREARIDRELAAAGILPGDPRLHPGGQPG